MEDRVQRRVQRYGWDLAAAEYEELWRPQLAVAQSKLLELAAPARGERILDVACGTGLVSFAAAAAVQRDGHVLGVDISGRMVDAAVARGRERGVENVSFERMDAECLAMADASVDLALCSLGLMYLPDPAVALGEMRRVLRPGGRMALAIWGEPTRCGWAAVFPVVAEHVASDVCPLFFQLGKGDALAEACAQAGFTSIAVHRLQTTLQHANEDEACRAAFVGGPVAMAWNRFSDATRAAARSRYLEGIAEWRQADGRYAMPGEFVIAIATLRPA